MEICERVEELAQQLKSVGDRAAMIVLTSAKPEHVQDQLTRCLVSGVNSLYAIETGSVCVKILPIMSHKPRI